MKKIVSLIISLTILAAIYWKIDLTRFLTVFKNCHPGWLALSLFMFIPITLITSKRLQMLAPEAANVSLLEALRLVLAASSLNMVLPSKMGDIAKGYFIAEKGRIDGSLSLSLVVYEKTCDMLSLMLWCVFGLIIYPDKDISLLSMSFLVFTVFTLGLLMTGSKQFSRWFFGLLKTISPKAVITKIDKLGKSWDEMCDFLKKDMGLLFRIAGISILIWFLHLLQIWFFILMLKAWVPMLQHLALAPLAIFVGLLPLTFAGMGTRDAALIFFYRGYMDISVAAALGLMCTLRYLVPAVLGLPFLNTYLSKIRKLTS